MSKRKYSQNFIIPVVDFLSFIMVYSGEKGKKKVEAMDNDGRGGRRMRKEDKENR